MYNYGPGQDNAGGQYPDNSANGAYGGQPQYPNDPNAYPQQPPQPQYPNDPNAYPQQPAQPQVPPTQPYETSPPVTSGPPASPAAPQYPGAAASPTFPTAPVTGPGPMDQTMPGGQPGQPGAAKKKSPVLPILAGVSALLLVATVVFAVLFLSAKSDLTAANNTIDDKESSISDKDDKISDLEDTKEDLEGEVDGLEGEVEALESDNEGAKDCIDAIEKWLAELSKESPDEDKVNDLGEKANEACAAYL